ncbi:hypothetical protein ANRL1_00180 [Anaerolineae bacterium]|nr:hypothetical protein ANRL1_00180 [Anaerolineae bacterium]
MTLLEILMIAVGLAMDAFAVSLGAATGEQGTPLTQVLADADAAMYAEKLSKHAH